MFRDVDAIENTKKPNYAATGYSIKKMIKENSPSKKKLVAAFKPEKNKNLAGKEISIA